MRGNNAGQDEIYFGFYNNTTLRLILNNTGWVNFGGAVTFNDGLWHHIAIVHDAAAGQSRCYVDGVQYDVTKSYTGYLNFGESHALIGADFDGLNKTLGNYLIGVVDDARLWSTARTVGEIAANKDAELVGNEAGLIGYWKFNSSIAPPSHLTSSFIDYPFGISVDPADNGVWVAGYNSNAVFKFDTTGTETKNITGFNRPNDVAVTHSDSSVWVTDTSNHKVVKLASDGSELLRLTGARPGKSSFSSPRTVSVNQTDDSVWVSDYYNKNLVKLSSAGTVLEEAGSYAWPVSASVRAVDHNLASSTTPIR